jgi:hypothetical protein
MSIDRVGTRRGIRVLAAALLAMALVPLVSMAPAHASTNRLCEPASWIKVYAAGGKTFQPLASPAGKYNPASVSSTLQYTMTTQKSASSTVEIGAKMNVKWGIAEVEAHTNYSATLSVSASRSVTDTLVVPGRHRGFDQPGVLRQRFHIVKMQQLTNCSDRISYDYGIVNIIYAWPYFAACVTTASSCSPQI